LFFVVDTIKAKPKQKRFVGFSYTINGQIVEDKLIKKIIISIYSNNNPNDPTFYFKSLGDKKLSVVFKNQLGIIVNHKKIYRLRKELGFVRPYRNHAYMFFYHNLRPHGSLNYMTPSEFSRTFSDDNNCFNSKTIFVKK